MKDFAERIRSGQLTVGTFVSSASPVIADVVGHSGLDWLIVDLEHGAPDRAAAATIVRSLRDTMPTVVRVPFGDQHCAESMLDAGAAGVLLPRITGVADAKQELASTVYAERRGLARAVPAFGWGADADRDPLSADADVVRIVQIETAAALDDAAALAALPEVEGLFLGPADLSLDLRRAQRDVSLDDAAAMVASAVRASGKVAGTLVAGEQDLERWVRLGFTFLACSADVRLVALGAGRIAAEAARLR